METLSSWAGEDGMWEVAIWSTIVVRVGMPAVLQTGSAFTTTCYDPKHPSRKVPNSLVSENESSLYLRSFIEGLSFFDPLIHSDGKSLSSSNDVSLYAAWTRSACSRLPPTLQDPSPSTYAVSFIIFALASILLYDGFTGIWRAKIRMILAVSIVAATVASISTTESLSFHSVTWMIPPILAFVFLVASTANILASTTRLRWKDTTGKHPRSEILRGEGESFGRCKTATTP